MTGAALAEIVDFYRVDASTKLDSAKRALLGQYMTPAPIARFMASLFSETCSDIRVLDPGAGVGSLTAALAERLCAAALRPCSVEFVCYEVDQMLSDYLRNTLDQVETRCRGVGIDANGRFIDKDFILCDGLDRQLDLFSGSGQADADFSHAILNPPYRKINAGSEHRAALRKAGIETSNLYTGFMFLAARHLRHGGEMVAIVPRSFCNGPYFKPFRERFFSMMHLRHIHVFEQRNRAFRDDDVLQENIILHAVKDDGAPSDVTITTSSGAAFDVNPAGGACNAEDLTWRTVPHDAVIRTDDRDRFVHIATNGIEQGIVDRMAHFTATLSDIGVEVSTGPVVDFRLRDDLLAEPEDGAVPLALSRMSGSKPRFSQFSDSWLCHSPRSACTACRATACRRVRARSGCVWRSALRRGMCSGRSPCTG